MKKILVLIFSLVVVMDVNADTTKEKATFNRCVDGDTAVFNINEEEIKFRFLAIDTPETVHPTKDVELYGKDASTYTCDRLTDANEIIVEYENSNKQDKYGRSLAWIWVDGKLLQQELIENGLAQVAYIYGNYKYTKSLCLIQSDVIQNKIGIWEDGKREVGYCSTVDLTDVQNNISLDDDIIENEINEGLEKTLEGIDNKLSNVNDIISENSNIYVYGFIIVAAIYAIYKEVKGK